MGLPCRSDLDMSPAQKPYFYLLGDWKRLKACKRFPSFSPVSEGTVWIAGDGGYAPQLGG